MGYPTEIIPRYASRCSWVRDLGRDLTEVDKTKLQMTRSSTSRVPDRKEPTSVVLVASLSAWMHGFPEASKFGQLGASLFELFY